MLIKSVMPYNHLNLYILLLFLNKEMEQAGREADGRVVQGEGTAIAKALRQEQT